MIIQKNVSLKDFNTFKLDARTKYLVLLESVSDIAEFAKSDLGNHKPCIILGGGSNILFTSDFDGVILHSRISGIEKLEEDNNSVLIKAGSGIVWDSFVEFCVEQNLGGVENLSNIPGCIGAAPVQNIGAYGVEAKDAIVSVGAFNLISKTFVTFSNKECCFGYRDSIFKQPEYKNYFITEVTFRLQKNPMLVTSYGTIEQELIKYPERNIKNLRQAIINIRSSKLPSEKYGSAGSFFKNPVVENSVFEKLLAKYNTLPNYPQQNGSYKIPAAWLIEKSGLKGYKKDNVGTYEYQPLVIINYGNATGNEIVNFSGFVQEKVFENFGIELEPEVCFI